jgi:hypothetical protein
MEFIREASGSKSENLIPMAIGTEIRKAFKK